MPVATVQLFLKLRFLFVIITSMDVDADSVTSAAVYHIFKIKYITELSKFGSSFHFLIFCINIYITQEYNVFICPSGLT